MRKSLIAAVLVASVAALLAVGSGQIAKADNNGASVYRDFGCGLFDGNGGFVW